MSRFKIVAGMMGLALGGAVILLAQIQGQGGPPEDLKERFTAHVSTDKPIYRAGEHVYIRGVILDADNHKPWTAQPNAMALVEITGPKGETLMDTYATIQDSVAGMAWDVPGDAAGGQYNAKISFPYQGFPPAERKFEIRAYRVPRLKGEIVFLRDGFGAGDLVKASLHVERAEGGIPAGAKVAGDAIVDNQNVFHGQTVLDASGNCSVEFKLPANITRGDGTLSLAVTDGGVVEPIAKTIPILLKTLDITMYPEGGDLIGGLSDRVYIEALTPAKKPADLVGSIVDSQGMEVAAVRTEHEGRGRFIFTPMSGEKYSLKLSQPSGIDKLFPLPEVKADNTGVVLMSRQDVTDKGQPVLMRLASVAGGTYTIKLCKHATLLASLDVKLDAGQASEISLAAPAWADGVLTATVFDAAGKPLAERLVFRKPEHILHVQIKADKSSYAPADGATLTVTTTDEQGKPIGAVVGITATDSSVLEMLEKRDRAPRLNAMALLEDDVRELADADAYLDPLDPKADTARDLLLGTQGWRRFATADEAKFMTQNGDAARRALADRQPPQPIPANDAMLMPTDDGPAIEEQARFGPSAGLDLQFKAGKKMPLIQPGHGLINQLHNINDSVLLPTDDDDGWVNNVEPTVRIYAHDLRSDRKSGARQDFTETLYWAAGVKTDPSTGIASVSFKLNDAVTSFKISADAFSDGGALGEGTASISSVQPFYVEPKIPLEVTTGDVIHLPIAAVNGTLAELPVQLSVDADAYLTIRAIDSFSLPPGSRDRRISQITVGQLPSLCDLHIHATAGNFSDQVTRPLRVQPLGFPAQLACGGTLQPNDKAVHSIEIPQSVVAGSIVTHAVLYVTPMGNLTEALRGLMQEPNGCFEQTSSTTFPLVMADQYFNTHSGVDPKMISDSNALLDKGYARLTGFECKNKGYEWFGEDPGHECLSAYGLLEFTEMSEVRTVDAGMIQNTRAWLMSHRDGKGGFTHERRAMHTWVADPDAANGYCTWALLETGQKGLDAEVAWLKKAATSDPNSYVKALAANALFLSGDRDGARAFMDQLARNQDKDGHVAGGTTTVVGSGGQSLDIETTSLATLAWLRDAAFTANVESSIRYLAATCQGGRYGSTQSTVLALRAILAYDEARAVPTTPGKAQLFIDGAAVGDAVVFDAITQGGLKLPDFSKQLTPGKHELQLRMTDGSALPYALSVNYNTRTPASSDQCKVGISVSLKDSELDEGAITQANVTVTNLSNQAIPTPIAIVGLPGGLEVRYNQLKELVKAQRIAAYEVRSREVILYWRDMEANQSVQIPLSLTAAVPGTYTGPASRAYLYYTDEFKQWVDGMKVTIREK